MITAEILDDFKRVGALGGSTISKGGLTWSKRGTETTTASVSDGQVKASGGSGNVPFVLPLTGPDFDLAFTIGEARVPTIINCPVFCVDDTGTSWYTILMRNPSTVPQYVIAWRGTSGNYSMRMESGVAPQVGDKVRISVFSGTIRLFVNGAQVGTSVQRLENEQYRNAGLLFNSADLETAFRNFAIY